MKKLVLLFMISTTIISIGNLYGGLRDMKQALDAAIKQGDEEAYIKALADIWDSIGGDKEYVVKIVKFVNNRAKEKYKKGPPIDINIETVEDIRSFRYH